MPRLLDIQLVRSRLEDVCRRASRILGWWKGSVEVVCHYRLALRRWLGDMRGQTGREYLAVSLRGSCLTHHP
jgi:hypothetical protein